MRRTIVRYVCLTFTQTLTMMSPKAKKRFPTLNHFVDAGLLTREEKKIIEDLDNEYPNYSKNWLPLAWAANITTRARHEGIIRDNSSVKTILAEINVFRAKCGEMLAYDWISIPLVYTQVSNYFKNELENVFSILGSDYSSLQLLPGNGNWQSIHRSRRKIRGPAYFQFSIHASPGIFFLYGMVESG